MDGFDRGKVDGVVAELAAAGVGVNPLGSETALTPGRRPGVAASAHHGASGQRRSGARAHSGLRGAEVDTLVRPDPLRPGASLARKILGTQAWAHHRSIVFATAVLTPDRPTDRIDGDGSQLRRSTNRCVIAESALGSRMGP
jgi:hypothetical protein